MRHVVMFSGGHGSYAAARRVAEALGRPPELLFTDTLVEDDDLYRFLVEAGADVLGAPRSAWEGLRWFWESVPPLGDGPGRLAHLRAFAAEASARLPGLHWEMDGRTPWEVFRKERFLGNTRAAKCSHALKQDVARAWLGANCDPARTTIYVGIHWSEGERYAGTAEKKGARELWLPWDCRAPLCEPPLVGDASLFTAMEARGIRRPRLYEMGFVHNNCGAWCVKAGQAHFRKLLEHFPERYAHHEREEEALRQHLGKDVAILRDRRGGVTRPLTLRELRLRVQAGGACDPTDFGGCGCFSSEREAG